MTQQIWTFNDRFGTEHSFGVYHNEDSGHFVAYLDNQVMIIDFGILDNKTFSFFFEQELLKFDVIKIQSGFEYSLKVDTETDTELNLELKKERNDERHIIILLVLIIIIVFLSLYFRNR